MSHASRTLAGAVLAAAAGFGTAACDGDSGSGPDGGTGSAFFSFEGGLEGWRPDSADFCELDPVTRTCAPGTPFAATAVEVVQAPASRGSQSVRLSGDNLTDAVKVWIERPFRVEAGRDLTVTVSFDFGTEDEEIGAWELIGAVSASDPTAAFAAGGRDRIGDFVRLGSTVSPEPGRLTFLPKSFSGRVTSGPRGELWVAIGVWGTFEVEREYFVDRVTVEIERAR
jgi:hypothetical protein